jgi:hypothetical protein
MKNILKTEPKTPESSPSSKQSKIHKLIQPTCKLPSTKSQTQNHQMIQQITGKNKQRTKK